MRGPSQGLFTRHGPPHVKHVAHIAGRTPCASTLTCAIAVLLATIADGSAAEYDGGTVEYHASDTVPVKKGAAMSIAEQAKRIYESRWKAELESKHRDQFVAIEPLSESYYLGDEFIEAAMAAKTAYPDRKSFVIRIGHDAAFHLGACAS